MEKMKVLLSLGKVLKPERRRSWLQFPELLNAAASGLDFGDFFVYF